jgi:PhnB protein
MRRGYGARPYRDCSLHSHFMDRPPLDRGVVRQAGLSTRDPPMAGISAGNSNSSMSISPWLSVPDANVAIEFYTTAFGAMELQRLEDAEGRVVVSELALGQTRFWVQLRVDASPASFGGTPVRMLIGTEEPDQLFDRAVAAGATVVASMQDSHGWRTGRVSDPSGHDWEIAKRFPWAP